MPIYTANSPAAPSVVTSGGVSGANYGYPKTYYSNSSDMSASKPQYKDQAELPGLMLYGYDDQGQQVEIKLAPEGNISSSDCMKIVMLMVATIAGGSGPSSFNALAFIKKNNLERHFTYS